MKGASMEPSLAMEHAKDRAADLTRIEDINDIMVAVT